MIEGLNRDTMKKTYWIYGTHAVETALANPKRQSHKLCLLKHQEKYAQYKQVKIELVDVGFFKKTFGDQAVHQGIALEVEPLSQPTLYEMLSSLKNVETALIAVLDQLTDPHNIGAILRSAAAFNVKALIVTQHATVSLQSAILSKAASGAVELVPIIEVTNLVQAFEILKKNEFWILGLSEQGKTSLNAEQLQGRYALVLGAEGKGMRRLTTESCDILVQLPTSQAFTTLNVSNAAAIAFYEFYRQNN